MDEAQPSLQIGLQAIASPWEIQPILALCGHGRLKHIRRSGDLEQRTNRK
jgi:hypothetical protein